jgi:hypothetical protein
MYNVVEKIGSVYLTIYSVKDKKAAERIAEQLQKLHKDRVIIVKKAKKP